MASRSLMGCKWSKHSRHHHINGKKAHCDVSPRPASSPPRTRGLIQHLEPLKLGSITETWKSRTEWARFVVYLADMTEGVDSDGNALSIARYAKFLELFVYLDEAERVGSVNADELRSMVTAIRDDPEDFFGTERCLRCIDKGIRAQVLLNLRQVRSGEAVAGSWVFQPVYPRVLDKLNELVGNYNAARMATNGSSKAAHSAPACL